MYKMVLFLRLYHSKKDDESSKATATATSYADEITFTFNMSLPGGNAVLYLINSEDDNEVIIDGFGVRVPDQTLTCYVAEALPPADVTVQSAKGNTVVLGFSKPVKGSNIRLYHTDIYDESNKAATTAADYVNELIFTFSKPLPIGSLDLFLVNSETEGEKLIDCDDIYVPDQSLTCEVEEVPAPQAEDEDEDEDDRDTSAPVVIQCIVNKIKVLPSDSMKGLTGQLLLIRIVIQ